MTVVLSRMKFSLTLIVYSSSSIRSGQRISISKMIVGLGRLKCWRMKLGNFKLVR
jgi:hypothetical protein